MWDYLIYGCIGLMIGALLMQLVIGLTGVFHALIMLAHGCVGLVISIFELLWEILLTIGITIRYCMTKKTT